MIAPIMSPRVVLGAVNADGSPPLPRMLGAAVVWSRCYPCSIGSCPAWEYRDEASDQLVTIQRVALVGASQAVWIAWVPSTLRAGDNALFDALAPALSSAGILAAYWPCAADGSIPAVEADTSANALAVLAAWPATWRQWAANDVQPDPLATPPIVGSGPSGPRLIGEGLA